MAEPASDTALAAAAASSATKTKELINLTIELSGGLELLFDKVKRHHVRLSPAVDGDDGRLTLRSLIRHVKTRLIKERVDLFAQDDTVRPGILVLVNDCDWELVGGLNHQLADRDVVTFISTLHGG